MYLLVDLVLIAIIVICIIIGKIRGFADQILGLLSGIVSFILALVFTPFLADIFYDTFMHGRFAEFISEKLSAISGGSGLGGLLNEGLANTQLRSITAKFGADYDSIAAKISAGTENVAESIAEPVAKAASYALGFISIFLVSMLIFLILKLIVHGLVNLPVLKTADNILGAILGGVIGICFVWVLSIIIKLGLPYLSSLLPEVFPEDLFGRSVILRLFYDLNALKETFDLDSLLGKIQISQLYLN